LRKSQRIWS